MRRRPSQGLGCLSWWIRGNRQGWALGVSRGPPCETSAAQRSRASSAHCFTTWGSRAISSMPDRALQTAVSNQVLTHLLCNEDLACGHPVVPSGSSSPRYLPLSHRPRRDRTPWEAVSGRLRHRSRSLQGRVKAAGPVRPYAVARAVGPTREPMWRTRASQNPSERPSSAALPGRSDGLLWLAGQAWTS